MRRIVRYIKEKAAAREKKPTTATEIIRNMAIDNAKKTLHPSLRMEPVFGRELEKQCVNLMQIIRGKDEYIDHLHKQLREKYDPYVEIVKETPDGNHISQMILKKQCTNGHIRFII